jgi:hypothetical protein
MTMTSRRGLTALAAAMVLSSCATVRDPVSGGDSRLDEATRGESAPAPAAKGARSCGPDGKGDLVLLDATTGGPLTCLPVTLLREPMGCPPEGECPSDVIFRGLSNPQGQVLLPGPVEKARLVAVADGFGPSVLANATSKSGLVLELELSPADGFWFKVLDADGNYLQDLSLTFKQGAEIVAQLRTNRLANVFFEQRQPFSGQAVIVEAAGFRPVTIAELTDLGDDGHTLVLSR